MRQAMRSSGARTKRAVIEEALHLLIQTRGQRGVRRLRGKVAWKGIWRNRISAAARRAERREHKDTLRPSTAQGEDRTPRFANHVVGRRAKEPAVERTFSMHAHHDDFGPLVLGDLKDCAIGPP